MAYRVQLVMIDVCNPRGKVIGTLHCNKPESNDSPSYKYLPVEQHFHMLRLVISLSMPK